MNLVKPLEIFGPLLNTVQSPSRYLGGEYGITIKNHSDTDDKYNFAVAFPDMYEIAMSNLAVKLMYNGLNALENVRCERVFAPDVDFESLLKEKDVPLFTLETGMPLHELDMLGFSIGYELGITEVLAMLELGKIPLNVADRTENDPIVIAGGCGVTNPLPLSGFFDAFFIGEAEPELFNLVDELSAMKKQGKSRAEMMEFISAKSYVWTREKASKNIVARRTVQSDFGLVPSVPSWFPLPSSKPVQDHGVIEIMRGCPNGCRFCHAGVYYRPTRVKNLNIILDEIDHLVFDAGHREISLNSLSSADFPDVSGLLDLLNKRYEGYNVSFQLPSLKVNSMSLEILEKLSKVRKSGLTFAVETPDEMWQLSLNKEVYAQHLETIIREAKARGWSSAKFYFMVGLPVGDYFGGSTEISEEKAIVDFMLELQAKTRIQCNVNVGVFIPKPHTAYERIRQITPEKAKAKIDYIFQNLPKGKFKMFRHNYDSTVLEGLITRGDERMGSVILNAYRKGARFDAWDEHLRENMKFWNEAFAEADFDVMGWIFRDWSEDEILPWHTVSLGPSPAFFKKEWQKSVSHELTEKCTSGCNHKCGICNTKENVRVFTDEEIEAVSASHPVKGVPKMEMMPESNIPVLYRVLFEFKRKDGSEWTAYLSQVEIFHKAILRSGLRFVFTAGFNPLARLEFVTAMTLGIPSENEMASCYLYEPLEEKTFIDAMNRALPDNLRIEKAHIFPVTNLRKREALSSNLWGGVYEYKFRNPGTKSLVFNDSCFTELMQKKGSAILSDSENETVFRLPVSDKSLRMLIEEITSEKWYDCVSVVKLMTLAKDEINGWTAQDEEIWRTDNKNFKKAVVDTPDEPVTFFELYEKIAKINLDLINTRASLQQRQEELFEQNPDLKKKRGK